MTQVKITIPSESLLFGLMTTDYVAAAATAINNNYHESSAVSTENVQHWPYTQGQCWHKHYQSRNGEIEARSGASIRCVHTVPRTTCLLPNAGNLC